MNLESNFSLKKSHTFGIDSAAYRFAEVKTRSELTEVLIFHKNNIAPKPLLIIGSGSNILFTDNFDGLIIKIATKGITIIEQNTDDIILRVEAGEIWDEFVAYTVDNQWHGAENLSLIPGTVGACPIQNIGAYGSEIKDIIESVEVLNIRSFKTETYSNEQCRFGYRDSIFKKAGNKHLIVIAVAFRLSKNQNISISYGNVADELKKISTNPTIKDVRNCICAIRNNRLPDPEKLGNAGSFFKNPIIETLKYNKLKQNYNDMPGYIEGELTKIPAAWLIEKCGFKGYRQNDAGVHSQQALVLVNYGNASGKDILNLAEYIKQTVKKRFDIEINFEVNII